MENLPWGIRVGILCVWMFVIPTVAGGCLWDGGRKGRGLRGGALVLWVSGQMLLWAGFQLICVPCVLLEKGFRYVIYGYGGLVGILTIGGIARLCGGGVGGEALGVSGQKIRAVSLQDGQEKLLKNDKSAWREMLPAVIVGTLLVFQLAQAAGLAYADGDDAYYVAVSSITNDAETMYEKLPYTGGTTEVDVRHGLAPFPIWIAFLARVTGLKAVGVAHTATPLMLIPMTYVIFYLLARELFPDKRWKRLLFLMMSELLILFGDYSFYTVEHFMLARSRQGKAALGSVILPMLLWLLFVLFRRVREGEKCGAAYWGLVVAVMISGCLCSSLGAFLLCLFMGIAGLCAAVTYRKWKLLLPMALSCLPCVCYAVLYLLA